MEMTTNEQQSVESHGDDVVWSSVSNPRRVRI